MSTVIIAASAPADGQPIVSATAFGLLVAMVLLVTTLVVIALAVLDRRSEPSPDAADTGLALLDAG